ncbi:MAG: NfeD family protein [Byssovorax sp.]
MGLVYVAALVIGLGVLLLQAVLGHGAGGHDLGDGHAGHADTGAGGFVGALLAIRFWIFASLAFGLSGSLIHAFSLAGPIATFLIALGAGVASGFFAVLAFRAVASAAVPAPGARQAIGQVGKVLVPLGRGQVGQVRVALQGSSVDLMATTDEEALARGEEVLVDDVNGSIAHVSKRPGELA